MRFPSAHAGVKKLFAAQIIMIAVAITMVVSSVLSILSLNGLVVATTIGTMSLITLAASILVFIFELVGYIQAGRDEGNFHAALWTVLIAIILSAVATGLGFIKDNSVVTKIIYVINALVDLSQIFVILFTINGLINLCDKMNNERLSRKGRVILFIILAIYVLALVFALLPAFFNVEDNKAFAITVAVFGVVAAVLELVNYVLYVTYLGQCTAMLRR
ncbi:MAG: hypothetical protein IJK27_02685 [Bacilli bacterium]|nr:hypothetical protein [Bacilli bacterium]